jgi:hypothetical protein
LFDIKAKSYIGYIIMHCVYYIVEEYWFNKIAREKFITTEHITLPTVIIYIYIYIFTLLTGVSECKFYYFFFFCE